MLRIYDVESMYQLNNRDEWKPCGHYGYTCKEDTEIQQEKIIFRGFDWNELRDYLKINHVNGIYNDTTLFRKRPFISISYIWDDFNLDLYEGKFSSISYKQVYTEREDVTLDWIIKHCTADQTITYLKQRGIQTCPILK